ncbi:MAG TPA: BON domain-containing protein [Gemmataceae bacterium]|jgi:hypothetical protein
MSGSLPRRGCRITVRSAVLAVGLLAGAAVAEPADPPSGADWQLALQARNALWDDPTFTTLNLGVSVSRGVATLRGPVPSAGVGEQAVERLRKLPGIREVVNETFVPAADEPLARSMPHPVTTQRPTVSVGPAVPAPEPAPPPQADAPALAKEPVASLGPPVAVPVKLMSLRDQIEAMRLWDRRFQHVRVELRDGVVTLAGTVARSADAWEFAAAVRQLPGVTGVIQKTTTDPR